MSPYTHGKECSDAATNGCHNQQYTLGNAMCPLCALSPIFVNAESDKRDEVYNGKCDE